VVLFGPQLIEAAAPQPELDAELDHRGDVPERQRLEHGDGAGRVTGSTVRLGKPHEPESFVRDDADGLEGLRAMARPIQLGVEDEGLGGEEVQNPCPQLGMRPRHVVRQRLDIDLRRWEIHGLDRVGACGRVGDGVRHDDGLGDGGATGWARGARAEHPSGYRSDPASVPVSVPAGAATRLTPYVGIDNLRFLLTLCPELHV